MSITYRDMQRLSELALLSLTLNEPSNSTAVQGLLNSIIGLDELLSITEQELKELDGMEDAKTDQLLAGLELAKRIYAAPTRVKVPLTSPDAVADFMMPQLRFREREVFMGLYLDRKNCLKFVETISVGNLTSSIVHPREVFKPAVKRSAASIILAHNHPSGDPAPSKEDISITKRLVEAGQIIGIEIIDHIRTYVIGGIIMSTEKVIEITAKLLKMFKEGTFSPAAARTFIARQAGDDKPSLHWSLGNQLIMLLSGTDDARGFRQWNEVKRTVNKGAKAIYILAPLYRKVEVTVTDPSGQEHAEIKKMLRGFRAVPVFCLEATNGTPLPNKPNYDPPSFPPLYEVARHFGMVSYMGIESNALGSCSIHGNIKLYSHDIDIFFHELGHSVHNTIKPLQGGQHADQEIVAEMSACILCELYCYEGYLWQGWEYLKYYSDQSSEKALRKIMQLLAEVEAVVSKILAVSEVLAQKALDVSSTAQSA